jgi:hypothetical protein
MAIKSGTFDRPLAKTRKSRPVFPDTVIPLFSHDEKLNGEYSQKNALKLWLELSTGKSVSSLMNSSSLLKAVVQSCL